MDQERLNHVLTAKPWERRLFIEEAAGIARYKQQRSETQGKLDATRLNMQRLRDVMEEVRRQLSSIERQARKAQQYKALQSERQGLDLALVAADYAALAAQHETVTREMESLREAEEQQRARVATLTGRQALQAAAIQDIEYRLGDLRQSVQTPSVTTRAGHSTRPGSGTPGKTRRCGRSRRRSRPAGPRSASVGSASRPSGSSRSGWRAPGPI